jgi:hypothetical protein
MLILVAVLLFLLLQGGISKNIFPTKGSTTTMVTGTNAPFNIKIQPSPTGLFERLNYLTTNPVGINFLAESPASGSTPFTFDWDFGDGTSGTGTAFTHYYAPNCVYDIRLTVTDSLGHLTTGTILFSVFPSKGSGGNMVVCPRRGTAGITSVELAGDFYRSNESLTPLVGGSSLAAVKADNGGSWALNVTKDFGPQVNGSSYKITTSPSSVTVRFLTLEGIRSSPTSGEPGDSFTLEGRSYPPNTLVSIYLNGVHLGQATSDGHGTFLAHLVVPSSLRYAGTYQFTTSPPVLGASATFTVPVSAVTPAPPAPFPWWLLVLAAVVVAAVLIVFFLRRRSRQAGAGEPGEEGELEEAEEDEQEVWQRSRRRRQVSLPKQIRPTTDVGPPVLG